MTENQNRVQAGIPTGGQYAATAHSDAVPNLDGRPTATHTVELAGTVELHNHEHPALPEWPANLPAPEVDFDFEDGQALTKVTIDGKTKAFWRAYGMDGVLSGDDIGDPNLWQDFDWDDQEAAMAYAVEVHKRIDSATVGLMTHASHAPGAAEAIIAHALDRAPKAPGAGPDLTDEAVRRAVVAQRQERVYRAQQELQQIYMVGVAQELREQHPEIASFELGGDGHEPRMDVAWDSDGNQIDDAKLNQANLDVFGLRSHFDFDTLMTSDPIYVEEAIAFRTGN